MQLAKDPYWDELCQTNPIVTFQLNDEDDLVCQRSAIVETVFGAVSDENIDSSDTGICLISGEPTVPTRLHTAIKGVWGAQTSGANIVSFSLDAFNSFGKKQGCNAPVSPRAEFAYTTALNHMLAKGSRQRVQVGDASTVFWAQKSDEFEESFASIFGEEDDPDSRIEQVRALLTAVDMGKFSGERAENSFYILGLAPNAARISVRFWYSAPLSVIAECVSAWFNDLKIDRPSYESEYPSLFRLLLAISVQQKADNIPPKLGGDVMRSILQGTPFPETWFNAAVLRSRAEQNVTYLRAAAIKACLNRQIRRHNREKEFLTMLDRENTSTAYRLGRLFATLERIQEKASGGIKSTIRDRFYGAASSKPVLVFTTLLRLKMTHQKKLPDGEAVWFEKIIAEILGGVDDFPKYLPLPEQGRFALGYYHQWQDFFTKKTDK